MLEKESLKFLERLTNSFGPSGFEYEPVQMVKNYVAPYVDEIFSDKMGSLVYKKVGDPEGPKILLPGHVDEIGFIINGISKDGFLTFSPLGGWFDQTLLAQRVLVKTREDKIVLGVVVSKPPHLIPPEDAKKVVAKEEMVIDVGCASEKDVKSLGIQIGDPAMPMSYFEILERKRFVKEEESPESREENVTLAIGKAFDDRVGAFIGAEVVRRLKEEKIAHPNIVFGAATTQEEVGLRGARTVAYMVNPDVALVLEVDISGDIPGVKPNEAPAKMGKGCSILTYDSSMVPNPRLLNFVIKTAKENNIRYQLSSIAKGGTDAGVIHITHKGCPSVVLGVPTRHIHSHNGILDLGDVEMAINLTISLVKNLDWKTVQSFTEI